jgi:hypothetical protein
MDAAGALSRAQTVQHNLSGFRDELADSNSSSSVQTVSNLAVALITAPGTVSSSANSFSGAGSKRDEMDQQVVEILRTLQNGSNRARDEMSDTASTASTVVAGLLGNDDDASDQHHLQQGAASRNQFFTITLADGHQVLFPDETEEQMLGVYDGLWESDSEVVQSYRQGDKLIKNLLDQANGTLVNIVPKALRPRIEGVEQRQMDARLVAWTMWFADRDLSHLDATAAANTSDF